MSEFVNEFVPPRSHRHRVGQLEFASGEADLRRGFECGPASLAARLRELVGREVEAHSAAIL